MATAYKVPKIHAVLAAARARPRGDVFQRWGRYRVERRSECAARAGQYRPAHRLVLQRGFRHGAVHEGMGREVVLTSESQATQRGEPEAHPALSRLICG